MYLQHISHFLALIDFYYFHINIKHIAQTHIIEYIYIYLILYVQS